MKDTRSIPILFPSDGLSFLPRCRSALKVILPRPENVKPSAVSKRFRVTCAPGVSNFPSYPTYLLLPFLHLTIPSPFSACHHTRRISIRPRTSLLYRIKEASPIFFFKPLGRIDCVLKLRKESPRWVPLFVGNPCRVQNVRYAKYIRYRS